jgi:hypothetical protein
VKEIFMLVLSIDSRRRKPLAAGIASLFALSASTAYATTLVTNCNDSGAGSLRAAVAAAPDGDTVDAAGLTPVSPGCSASTISLKTGAIVINQNYLGIKGPGMSKLTVTALYDNGTTTHQYQNRIFTGNSLSIQNLSVRNGLQINAASPARGGCIYSKGSVSLSGVDVSECVARTTSSFAIGGGIYARGSVTLNNSTVSGNYADAGGGGDASGGGIYAGDLLRSQYSNVVANFAGHANRAVGTGGGIVSHGTGAGLYSSTIAENTAGRQFGGMAMLSHPGGTLQMASSTISGNRANGGPGGGLYAIATMFYIKQSTIAFNSAANTTNQISPGLHLVGVGGSSYAYLRSTLIANNVYGAASNDFTVTGTTVTGLYNLVRTPHAPVPDGTIIYRCPLLGPLRDNGGPTLTHALLSHSWGIDKGTTGFETINYDQRGSPFGRYSGSYPDVGAYEVQQGDVLFNNGFDGCP